LGSATVSPHAEPGSGGAEIRNPRGDLMTLIDYEALGWETYGILRTELQRAMLAVAPTDRLRLGTTCIGVTEDAQVLLEGADVGRVEVDLGRDTPGVIVGPP
jgi:hypothetical protein